MNKQQLEKEVKEHMELTNDYSLSKEILEMKLEFQHFKPCEDCNNSQCQQNKNRVVYCKDRT